MNMKPWVKLICLGVVLTGSPAAHALEQSTKKQDAEAAAQTNTQLALAYLKQGDLRYAKEKIDKALEQDPRQPVTQMTAGFIYDQLGEDKKARQHFESARRFAGSNSPEILNNVGVYFCRKGDFKKGSAVLQEAAKSPLNRTPEVTYLNAAQCARSNKQDEAAAQYLRQALALNSQQPEVLYQLTDLFLQKDPLKAQAFFSRYREISPQDTPEVLWLGYRVESAAGNPGQAQVYANLLREKFPNSSQTANLP
jgi:type IV pilus assembly protein PilF